MRKISVTPEIVHLVNEQYVNKIHNSKIHAKILNDLNALRSEFMAARKIEINTGSSRSPSWVNSPSSSINYVDYLDAILSDYDSGEILKWQPVSFIADIAKKDLLVYHGNVNCAMKINGQDKASFANRVVKALHYEEIRKCFVSPIYRQLALKSCVYCNANYTISDENGECYYDLDHWKPKSFYPYLAISFFNLQPSCSSCNRRKSSKDIEFFCLWDDTHSLDLDVLRFKLDERSLVNYLVFLDNHQLQVKLVEANPHSPLQQQIKINTEDVLHLEARYAEHNDYTEEIVWKSKIYNPSMIQSFRDIQISTLIPNQADLERFVLGTYSDPDDIHKRPLTRLAIDVVNQLGLW